MREDIFLSRRQADWDALEAGLAHVGRSGLRALAPEDVRALALGYRAATTDLACARSRRYDPETIAYLNGLVARAHAYVYGARAVGGAQRLRAFACDFPREFRASLVPIGVCTLVTILGAAAAYGAVATDPRTVFSFLPDAAVPEIKRSLHDSNFAFDLKTSPMASSEILTNNVRCAAVAFAGGMTGAILTMYVILFNGIMIGALGALFAERGFGIDFIATIVPHGVLELTAIQIAGAAGLLLGRAMLAPGRLRRSDALRIAGRRAVTLFGGVVGMLVIAATIEGFFTPLRTSIPVRLAFGATTAVLLAAYLGLVGRGAPLTTSPEI